MPTFRFFVGEVLTASAAEGDPADVTYSAHGSAVWDPTNYQRFDNIKAYNPMSLDVQNKSAKPGDPCLIWTRSDGLEMLLLFTLSIPFDDCPGTGGSAPMSANDELRKKGGIIIPNGDGSGPRQPGGGSPPISGGGVVTR